MTAVLDDLPAVRRRVEDLKAAVARAEGTVERIVAELKTKYGLAGPKAAAKELARLKAEERRLAEEYTRVKREFEEAWAAHLAGGGDE